MTRRWLLVGSMAGVVLALAFVAVLSVSTETPAAFVNRWLEAVAGRGAADRGWSQLSEASRSRFADEAAYRNAAEQADWSAFAWSTPSVGRLESWLYSLSVEVDGGLAAVPEFLRLNRLVNALCVDDDGLGIHLLVERHRPFGEDSLGPGGFTGSNERAVLAGRCDMHGAPQDEAYHPSARLEWTGHPFRVRNDTTTALYLLGDNGGRLDVGACSSVDADELASTVEVRADDGYVSSFSAAGSLARDDVTVYIVIGPTDVYIDGSPPLEPATCTGPAAVPEDA